MNTPTRIISKQENRYKTRGENNTRGTYARTTQQVTTKNEFDERWDKTNRIKTYKKKKTQKIHSLSNSCYYLKKISSCV